MSIDKSAIEHIQKTSTDLREVENTDHKVIAITPSLELKSLEQYQEFRNQFRGKFHTSSMKDYEEYLSEHNGTNCFIDIDSMSSNSIFDLGDKEKPGHAKHTASLKLKKTAPYSELIRHDQSPGNQRELAEWIEDWKDYIQIIDETGADMDIVPAVAAIRRITIEAIRKQGNETRTFGESKSSLESIDAKSEDGNMPAWIVFTCKPYEDLPEHTFHSRISILTSTDKPKLVTRIIQLEAIQEEIATEFKELLKKDLPKEIDIFIGTFAP